jgi:hypothetical protein
MLDRRDVLRGFAAGAVIGCLPAKPSARRTVAFAPLGTLRLALAGAAITGGSFSGPRLRGKVIAGGVSSRVRPDGVVELELRAVLETDDAQLVDLTLSGLGSENDARTIARFETAGPRYAFLDRMIAVGRGSPRLQVIDELL